MDVNPYLPLGIDAAQIRFTDIFLLHCLLADSPECDDPERARNSENQLTVVNRGREPGVLLHTDSGQVPMADAAREMLEAMEPIAGALDAAHGGEDYRTTWTLQGYKVADSSLTPSAQILADMRSKELPFFSLAMEQSRQWAESFSEQPLPADKLAAFRRESEASLERQREVEAADDIDFEAYLERYYSQYDAL